MSSGSCQLDEYILLLLVAWSRGIGVYLRHGDACRSRISLTAHTETFNNVQSRPRWHAFAGVVQSHMDDGWIASTISACHGQHVEKSQTYSVSFNYLNTVGSKGHGQPRRVRSLLSLICKQFTG